MPRQPIAKLVASTVPNILFAPKESYAKATQRVWHTAEFPTAIELPVID